ncbi:MAG: DNA polymerase III subunit delta [Gammaproteobacteria bacterium]|nr:DNA polymerase III subunit delta [Gammaproteobacteria bacterium]
MNVRPDQLKSVLKKQLYPVYLVSGDEPLQQMESLDVIRSFLRDEDYAEREVLDVDAQFDWQRLMDEAANMSLFATRRIVELRLPSGKPGRQGSQVLKDYLSRPPEDTVLIVNAGKVDGNAKKSAWFKAIEQNGLVVQCWPVPVDKLTGWLQQRFKKRDMDADNEVLAYVSQHVEGNLLAADQEIEKLYLLLGPGKISYADVAEAVTSQSRYNVFELVDVLLSGNVKRAIKVVAGLKAEGVVPVVVNWALAKDIRLLAKVAQDSSSVDFNLKRSGVWQSRVALFKSCLSRHTQRSFHIMLKRCAHIDAASKGLLDSNVWDDIESLCVRLAGSVKTNRQV